jgi:hypothetical protein
MNGYPGTMRATMPSTSATPELAQFQSQLSTFAEPIQEMNRSKVKIEKVWCIICKVEGHIVNYYPSLRTKVAAPNLTPAPTSLPGKLAREYCEIYMAYGQPHSSA